MKMRCQARQLDSYSTARHCSTAGQLDRTRQSSTELDRPRHPGACSQPRLASTGSTATRQLLDSYSTATRQLLDRLDRQGLDSPSTAASTAARRSPSTARQLATARAKARPGRLVRSAGEPPFTMRKEGLQVHNAAPVRPTGTPSMRSLQS